MASTLAKQDCEVCTAEDEPLTQDEYADYLAALDDPVWEVVAEHHLEGTYAFENFRDALDFTYEIGELAERSGTIRIFICNGARCGSRCGLTKSTDCIRRIS
jgi:hypothetical protein